VIAVVAPGDSGKGITAALAGIAGVRTVVNPNPERGMLSSVQTGVLVAANADALLVCPCDLPQLQQRQVAAVLEEYGSNGASAESIVAPVPVSGGKRGHPTLFGAANFPHILALDPEAFGLNEVLKRRANQVVEVMVSGEGVLRDADTPDEWRALTAETKRDAKQGTTGP
jgi:CTP:molybdopterin cytidylyltransferase MocA